MKYPHTNILEKLVEALIENKAYKATKYLSEKLVINATHTLYSKKLPAKNQNLEFTIVIGRPNYEQREFIKKCKKAGEPFPVKKVQLKFPPKERK